MMRRLWIDNLSRESWSRSPLALKIDQTRILNPMWTSLWSKSTRKCTLVSHIRLRHSLRCSKIQGSHTKCMVMSTPMFTWYTKKLSRWPQISLARSSVVTNTDSKTMASVSIHQNPLLHLTNWKRSDSIASNMSTIRSMTKNQRPFPSQCSWDAETIITTWTWTWDAISSSKVSSQTDRSFAWICNSLVFWAL